MSAVLRSSVGWGCPLACMSCSCRLITARSVTLLGLLHGCVDCLGNSKPCVWLCSLVRGLRLQGVPFAAMRHKLLPVSAGYATICQRSLVGGGELVHHCDSGVLEASMLVRSVEL